MDKERALPKPPIILLISYDVTFGLPSTSECVAHNCVSTLRLAGTGRRGFGAAAVEHRAHTDESGRHPGVRLCICLLYAAHNRGFQIKCIESVFVEKNKLCSCTQDSLVLTVINGGLRAIFHLHPKNMAVRTSVQNLNTRTFAT